MNEQWQSKPTVQYGDVGEQIVAEWLTYRGWTLSARHVGRHEYDYDISKGDKSLKVEIKTHKPFRVWPDCTGMDQRDYRKYIQYNDMWLFVVDLTEKCVWTVRTAALSGFALNVKMKDPNLEPVVRFPTCLMQKVFDLTEAQMIALSEKTNNK